MKLPLTLTPPSPTPTPSPAPSPATWVLLRGLTRGQGHWGGFVDTLQAAWPGARILTPELPGNGQRWRERSPATIAAFTDGLLAELQAQGLGPAGSGPLHWLGLSLGGMVVVDLASRHPAWVAQGVLVNSSLRPFSPIWQRLRPANYPALLRLALGPHRSPTAAARCEATLLRLTTRLQTEAQAQALLARWTTLRLAQPVHAANALRQLWAAARFTAPRQPPGPALVVALGAADGLVHPDCSRRLAQAWGLPCLEHPDAGHDLPQDAGAWLAEQLATQRAPAMAPAMAPPAS